MPRGWEIWTLPGWGGEFDAWNARVLFSSMEEFKGQESILTRKWPRYKFSHRRMTRTSEKPTATPKAHLTLLNSTTSVYHTKNEAIKNCAWVGHWNIIFAREGEIENTDLQLFKCAGKEGMKLLIDRSIISIEIKSKYFHCQTFWMWSLRWLTTQLHSLQRESLPVTELWKFITI